MTVSTQQINNLFYDNNNTLQKHWFTDKYQGGIVGINEALEVLAVASETFTIPGDNTKS